MSPKAKKITSRISIIIFVFIFGWWVGQIDRGGQSSKPITIINPRPLDKYSIENLSNTPPKPGKISIAEIINEDKDYTSYLFFFEFDPEMGLSKNEKIKKTSGQINVPKEEGVLPLILMLRGYVDQEIYQTGIGTSKAAEYFVQNGFITIAPDFFGYGQSDEQSEDVMEARFQTYTTVLSLISSLDQVEVWDKTNLFMWGHSNGGQVALTTLEIINKNIPTTLWAPVSKPFPYSILYYTDESEDRGKFLRKQIADFEETYNPDLYSLDLYLDRINSPIQLHQGTQDDSVPVEWSNNIFKNLKALDKNIVYHTYPGADHNLKPSWDTIVARDISFFTEHLDSKE